jgi:hypothetical protein
LGDAKKRMNNLKVIVSAGGEKKTEVGAEEFLT